MGYEFVIGCCFTVYIYKTSKQKKLPRNNISNNKMCEFFKDLGVCCKLLKLTVRRPILFNLHQFVAVRLVFLPELC